MKSDRNGLALLDDSKGTYKGIIYDMVGGYYAVTGLTYTLNGDTSNYVISSHDDARDAAYVSQKFSKKYDREDVKEMVNNGTFALRTNSFVRKLSIPKWQYPSVTEGTGNYEYVKQYVETPSAALIEAFDEFNYEGPRDYDTISNMLNKIDDMFRNGIPLRKATRDVIGLA